VSHFGTASGLTDTLLHHGPGTDMILLVRVDLDDAALIIFI
jgi:hypothetical protein